VTAWFALDPIQVREFTAGLLPGLLALAFGGTAGVAWRLMRGTPLPAAGLLLAAGAMWGLWEAVTLPPGLVEGVVALAGAGLAAGTLPMPQITGTILAIPGAWMLAYRGDLVEVDWIRILVAAAIVVGAPLVADFDRRWRRAGFPPVLFAVGVVGVYFAVPDTEQAAVLLGAALPLALLGWPRALAGLGSAGAYAATGLVVWTAAAGGTGRPSSIVGGIACLGLLTIEPVARAIAPRGSSLLDVVEGRRWAVVPVAAGQLALVYVASRWAGLRPTVSEAVVIVVVELMLVLVAVAGLGGRLKARPRAAPLQQGGEG
jgi:hypothetical protein